MARKYDLVFVTHLPSFYKVNLYNELARRMRVFVIFVASSSAIRTRDFVRDDFRFDHALLHEGHFEQRPKLATMARLFRLLARLSFNKIVVGGWDLPEFWLTVLTTPRFRNAVAVESTIVEGASTGWKLRVKELFISRIGTAFPSGRLHQNLLDSLGFRGKSHFTRGVGIFNRDGMFAPPKEFAGQFLYVGRLSPEKNLPLLLEAFRALPKMRLTIVGAGPQEAELKAAASANVSFRSHVPNEEIAGIYRSHDVFILPSLGEPWGLVVDEALYYGLPVIVSHNVGCHTELVRHGVNGLVFDPRSGKGLIEVVRLMATPGLYNEMRANVAHMDFAKRDEEQLRAYQQAVAV